MGWIPSSWVLGPLGGAEHRTCPNRNYDRASVSGLWSARVASSAHLIKPLPKDQSTSIVLVTWVLIGEHVRLKHCMIFVGSYGPCTLGVG